MKQRQELDDGEQAGLKSGFMRIAEQPVERRRSMPAACRECVSRRSCALSRSLWFQSIKTIRFYSRHVSVVRQGDPCKQIHILKHGWMQVTHIMPNGKSIVDLWPPGSIIGVAPAMVGEPYPYSAMALEDCEIEQADAVEVLKHLKKDPHVAFDILRYISRQATKLLGSFYVAVAKIPMEDRLLKVLVEISSACGAPADGGVRINLPLPVQVLADWIGCSRQWTSKLLSDLEARGAIKRHNGWITLTQVKDTHRVTSGQFQ